ncbi:MAG TPA: hypothetical protein VG963_08520, partial [Polyangiaceae bacterium]|nr:hypothetical protein [Polyangiaceae bacterium]
EYRGELRVKLGVTPLVLEAPGSDSVTDLERFMLAGRTIRGAAVSVAGNTISVGEDGRFSQLMSIDAVGETKVTVRANQPGLAPRFASFRLERVANLAAAAAVRRRGALAVSEASRDPSAHLGSTVWVHGKVAEVRPDGHRLLLLVEADGDCAGQCLVRLTYGGLREIARGSSVTAIGKLERAVGVAGGAAVPEIEVSLLL